MIRENAGDFLWVCRRSHLLVPNRSYVTFDIKKSAMRHGEISFAGSVPDVRSPHRRRFDAWTVLGVFLFVELRWSSAFLLLVFIFTTWIRVWIRVCFGWSLRHFLLYTSQGGNEANQSMRLADINCSWWRGKLNIDSRCLRLCVGMLRVESQMPLHRAKHFTRRIDNEVRCVLLIDIGKSTTLRYIAQTNWDLSWSFFHA